MTQAVLESMGGRGEPLLFTHANGYPPGSYRELFHALERRFSISAMEHRPLWAGRQPPRELNWTLFADDLLTLMQSRFDEPIWVMGHSMGGTVAALAASRQPERFRGVVLLDPVLLQARYALMNRVMPRSRIEKMPMIRRALGRPEYFSSHDEAFAFYRGKRAFRGLSDTALRHYVEAAKQSLDDGRVQLRFSPAWEAAIYASAPSVSRMLKRLSVHMVAIRGRDSDTLNATMWQRLQHWQPEGRFAEVAGGHLFPLEHPHDTAKAVEGLIFSP